MLKYNCAQVQKVYVSLTQLVEVCVNPVRSRYGADQSGFDEGTPFVHQNSLASNIILAENRVHKIFKTQLHIHFKIHISLLWLCTQACRIWIQIIRG